MRYGKEFKKVCRHLGIKGKTLNYLRYTYIKTLGAITGDIKIVYQEIVHSSVVMTGKYAKFNLRELRYAFPSLEDRINFRLKKPSEVNYFTTLLNAI
tara:strand:+ start:522 stop:812 length:291 start_codon:yes stop_codon:yes gene_type:complete